MCLVGLEPTTYWLKASYSTNWVTDTYNKIQNCFNILNFIIAVRILKAFDGFRTHITCVEDKYVSQLHHKCICKIETHLYPTKQRHADPRVHPIGFLLNIQNSSYSTQINVSLTNYLTYDRYGIRTRDTAVKGLWLKPLVEPTKIGENNLILIVKYMTTGFNGFTIAWISHNRRV